MMRNSLPHKVGHSTFRQLCLRKSPMKEHFGFPELPTQTLVWHHVASPLAPDDIHSKLRQAQSHSFMTILRDLISSLFTLLVTLL